MTDQKSRLNPLEWEGNYYNRAPVWPQEPDIAIIKALAKQHLASKLQVALDDAVLDVTFFAGGAINKVYLVSCSGIETDYLFRATLPLVPYFKTESEVATLAYLRARTSIPVAQVVAWDSNAQNELGFEWVLMEKLGGVELGVVWRKIPWQRKLELVDEIARFNAQLRTHTFGSIGSLYFKSALAARRADVGLPPADLIGAADQECKAKPPIPSGDTEDEFAIGPMFSSIFYFGSRLYLPGNRGPYKCSREWLKAEIEMQLAWIKAGPVEGDPEYDDDFEDEAPDMITECYRYLDTLPAIFPEEEDQPFSVLHHHDLIQPNILVDAETFDITGIIDWEMVNIVPIWSATDHPEWLKEIEPVDDEEPPIPSYDDEDDIAVCIRDQWDSRILRDRFDETMERLTGGSGTIRTSKASDIKRDFASTIIQLCDNVEYAQRWLEKYKAGIAEVGLEPQSKNEDHVNYDNIDGLENGILSDETQDRTSRRGENTGDETGIDLIVDSTVARAIEKTSLEQTPKEEDKARSDNVDGLDNPTASEDQSFISIVSQYWTSLSSWRYWM